MVVANAVAALAEIHEVSGKDVFQITSQSLFKLLRALNECTEWGQVFILDSLATYRPRDSKDAESIVERVTPRLQHANCAVVLSAVKVILKQLDLIEDQTTVKTLHKKMAPPLVTLLSAESEIQYVALRNINLIVQKNPGILAHEVKVFFCKYNDPLYVKMEKLEIMIKLANERNIDQVLLEFKEYATEVDVDFVRRSVRAIGRCAISLERAAERCINVLLELIQTKVNYVVQEAIIVIKDIFRRYPNRYESIIATLCENLDTLDEPEAKASMIWIIGEYAERIDNADELLEQFLETFPEETSLVQLQLVTATVKLFLKKPTERPQQMIQLVLTYATQETDNPDLRDRAYVYWRLLSTDPEAAKEVVLAEKPVIADTSSNLEPALLDVLLANLSTLSSVYHKPPETFVSRTRLAVQRAEDMTATPFEEDNISVVPSDQGQAPGTASSVRPDGQAAAAQAAQQDLLGDLLDLNDPEPAPAAAAPPPANHNSVQDLLGGLGELGLGSQPAQQSQPSFQDPFGAPASPPAAAPPAQQSLPVLLSADKAKGLTLRGQIARMDGRIVYNMHFHNGTQGPLDNFMIQFNKNSFGLAPGSQNVPVPQLGPGISHSAVLPLVQNPALVSPTAASSLLQVAIRNNQQGVFYFNDQIPLTALMQEDGRIEPAAFVQTWKNLPEANETQKELPISITSLDSVKSRIQAANIFLMAHKQVPNYNEEVIYLTGRVATANQPTQLLLEVRFSKGAHSVKAFTRSERPDVGQLLFDVLPSLLGA
ncbi:hypothetical protein ABBQ32_005169 [Trebouxia sp. C0010 RCD-2024]